MAYIRSLIVCGTGWEAEQRVEVELKEVYDRERFEYKPKSN